jgi:hypothetical protein
MAVEKREFDKQMTHLDAEIRRLEAEYNMYFAGRLPRPPVETRNRVAGLVKKHDNSVISNTADRFRFETLQTRYYKFIELVERQLTNRELGRPTLGVKRQSQTAIPATTPEAAAAEAAAQKSAEGAATGADQKSPAHAAQQAAAGRAKDAKERVVKFNKTEAGADARVKELYEQLAAAKKQVGEAPVAYDRVAALVKAQVNKFGDEGTRVAFKIALKDGKVSLTVKPEKGD